MWTLLLCWNQQRACSRTLIKILGSPCWDWTGGIVSPQEGYTPTLRSPPYVFDEARASGNDFISLRLSIHG